MKIKPHLAGRTDGHSATHTDSGNYSKHYHTTIAHTIPLHKMSALAKMNQSDNSTAQRATQI